VGDTSSAGISNVPSGRMLQWRFVRTTNRQMPAYREEVLSDADLADLYAYLNSIPQGPDAKTIPLLNQQ
jgi:mono/diheme cytochrome c family protein